MSEAPLRPVTVLDAPYVPLPGKRRPLKATLLTSVPAWFMFV